MTVETDGSGLSSAWLLDSCTIHRTDDASGWQAPAYTTPLPEITAPHGYRQHVLSPRAPQALLRSNPMTLTPTFGRWFFPHGKWIGQSTQEHAHHPDAGCTSSSARLKAEWHAAWVETSRRAQAPGLPPRLGLSVPGGRPRA